jgi:Carboxypeptidase regulatory-like domain
MKRIRWFQYAAAGIAGFGFVLPSGALAAGNQTPLLASSAETQSILDVSLGDGGTLSGQVLDVQGAPIAQTTVTVRNSGSDPASAVTDAQGSFSVAGLKGGVYEVTVNGASGTFRLWTAAASPPSANKGVLIVSGAQTTRGQFFTGPNKAGALVMVGLLGGVVAAGIITAAHHSGS